MMHASPAAIGIHRLSAINLQHLTARLLVVIRIYQYNNLLAMIYFKSKYLSDKLDINLAKWKRWSREFLDPDPLGGYQSGVARQFSFKDAFRVFLGGHLVGVLNFTIPQARQILIDLNRWLKKNRLYSWPKPIIAGQPRLRPGPDRPQTARHEW